MLFNRWVGKKDKKKKRKNRKSDYEFFRVKSDLGNEILQF